MGEKSVWDNVKKFVGSIVMTGTIMGANGVSLANDINVNDNINNQVNNEQVYDYDFQERFRSGETGLSSIDSRAFFKSGDRAGTFIDGKKDFAEKKGWWNKELEDKCNKILGDRKKVADAMNKFEEKKFDELKVPKELLEKYSSMNLNQIKEVLNGKVEGLINKDLVSLYTQNDPQRIENLEKMVSNLDNISDKEMAQYASKLDITINNNKNILQNKRNLLSNNKEYNNLKEKLEQMKNMKKPKGPLSPTTQEDIKLAQEQALIEAQILNMDSQVEAKAMQMTYDKNKTFENTGKEETIKKDNKFIEGLKVSKADLQPIQRGTTQAKSKEMELEDDYMRG